MKYHILFTIVFCSTFSFSQEAPVPCPREGICPYHEVILKNNYQLSIGDTVEDRRTLCLKGPGIDTVLRSVKLRTPNAYLGWLAADVEDLFVLYSTYSGNYPSEQPVTVNVYLKQTGEMLVTGPLIDLDTSGLTLLFIDFRRDTKLGLFDLQTKKLELFEPMDTPCESWWWCIKATYVTDETVSIDYRDWNNRTNRKIYGR